MPKLFRRLSTVSWLQPVTTQATLEEELELLAKERLRAVARYHRAAAEVDYHNNLIEQYKEELDILKDTNGQTQNTEASHD